ncbi:MAG: ABC transporter permease subunit [Candidatus Peribacteria bacterium]|nr:ABC transporter permease subunit [Candidatus Peribacteria bacterium]
MDKIKKWLNKTIVPFEKVSNNQSVILLVFWLAMLLFFWIRASVYAEVSFLPSPNEVGMALGDLWSRGLVHEFATSMSLCLQATFYALLVSMFFSYLSPLAWIRPLAQIVSKIRFLPMVGITFYLTQAGLQGRSVQITILTLFVSVYFITSLMSMIAEIPIEEYNLARTMGCSRWEMLWRVVIKGRLDYLVEILRQNLAITWMMFVTVEVIVRSAGGVGIWLKDSERMGAQDSIFAIQLLIFALGALIDWSLAKLKPALFPYSRTQKTF